MKADWTSDRSLFKEKLRTFQCSVAKLANELFDTDSAGELPIYVRIVDRRAFQEDDHEASFDVGVNELCLESICERI